MKKQMLIATVLLAAVTIANGQSWSLNGNNVTDTSKLGSKNNKPVRFVANNQEWMRLTPTGNLGVGTTAPASRLHVISPSDSRPATFDGAPGMNIGLNEGGVYRGYIGSYAGAATDVDFGTGGGNTTGKLHLTIQTSPKLTIDAGGNVGIGTMTPLAKLHVAGRVKIDGANSLEFGAGLSKEINAGTIGYGNITPGELDITGAGTTISNRKIKFWSEGGAEFTGNVGIGTAPGPSYKLNVCGTIRTKELRVETGWCDYVFERDYRLPSLKEVEAFIKKNKHLPDVTPGAQIENNGLEVGKVSSQMIKKIEELTLYVIELQKQVDALKNHHQ